MFLIFQCTFDCAYQAKKWVSTAGVLSLKQIATDFGKGLEPAWNSAVGNAVKACHANATSEQMSANEWLQKTNKSQYFAELATAKMTSGYVTKCKAAAFTFQTCVMSQLYQVIKNYNTLNNI